METFQSFEKTKPVLHGVTNEQGFEGDESWLRQQIKELINAQDEGRQQQLAEARQRAAEISFSQANYMKDALPLALEPDQLTRFGRFFSTLESLEK